MYRILLFRLAFALSLAGTTGPSSAAPRAGESHDRGTPIPVVHDGPTTRTSSGTAGALAARETAGPDTFAIYGGPERPLEGTFELGDGTTPGWGGGSELPGGYGGGAGAWTPVDLTSEPTYWHRSTFNADNLNGHGPGNHAMWCGVEAGDPLSEGWVDAPGYGNGWFEELLYESAPLADPSVGQVVDLDFVFNIDVYDQNWDFLHVEYDSAGFGWVRVASVSDRNRDENNEFPVPGLQFSAVQERSIVFTGNDYGGVGGDRIRIRLLVTSDVGWSDEDGLAPTLAGLCQVDDISLTTSQGSFTEDFESDGPWLFEPHPASFAGDFADVHPRLSEPDPCRSNQTPVLAFVDYGQTVRNGPGPTGLASTGGSTSIGVEYGFPGFPVVNYTGGLSGGTEFLRNEVWSPDIAWDLPGTEDDDPAIAGAVLHFDVWRDLPLANGIAFQWRVRSAAPGEGYTDWKDRNFVYFGAFGTGPGGVSGRPQPGWLTWREVVSDLLVAGPERVQVALSAWDVSGIFGLPGTAATPSPAFDNVVLMKFRVQGPAIAARNVDLAQDGFPVSGSIDVSSPNARDALDIPFDMARDVNSGDFVNEPGDSVVVEVKSVVPGADVTDIRMVWALGTNPLFDSNVRTAPARAKDENVVAGGAGSIWAGEVVADTSTTSTGAVMPDLYFVDLPDEDLLYPGDVLHYYIRATDSDGRVSTLPTDTSGFGDFGPTSTFDRSFRVRGLPTLRDSTGDQPRILVYNEAGRSGGEAEWYSALAQLGLLEGVDYDSYTVQTPGSFGSNGIGSAGAHGAASAQLVGYDHLFHFTGDLHETILSNGDRQQSFNDKGDDVGTLRGWLDTPGTRNVAHFGDGIATGNVHSPETALYVTEVMGVELIGPHVRPSIGDQTAPRVLPNAGGSWTGQFSMEYVAYGGCVELRAFDQIRPLTGAEAGHYFVGTDGAPVTDPGSGVASVIHPLPHGVSITFPYAPRSILDVVSRAAGANARAQLFAEVLSLFGAGVASSPPVAAPPTRPVALSVRPNPFNPSTVVEFTAVPGSRGSVRVYNLRGELVRELHAGEFRTMRFSWDGTDDRGASVASGIYVVLADDGEHRRTQKVALVK